MNDFVLVARDAAFYDFSAIYGASPKVIWLRSGNQTKAATLVALTNRGQSIESAWMDELKACIEIY